MLPRGRAKASDDEDEDGKGGDASELAAYLKDPTPDTVLVIESSRYDFEGEDKTRMERVQKYYACVPMQVEFRAFDPSEARALAHSLAKNDRLAAWIRGTRTAAGGDRRRCGADRD